MILTQMLLHLKSTTVAPNIGQGSGGEKCYFKEMEFAKLFFGSKLGCLLTVFSRYSNSMEYYMGAELKCFTFKSAELKLQSFKVCAEVSNLLTLIQHAESSLCLNA